LRISYPFPNIFHSISTEFIFEIEIHYKNDALFRKNAPIIPLVPFPHKEKATIGIGIGWTGQCRQNNIHQFY
jgi:hypothetical protein